MPKNLCDHCRLSFCDFISRECLLSPREVVISRPDLVSDREQINFVLPEPSEDALVGTRPIVDAVNKWRAGLPEQSDHKYCRRG